MPWSKNPGIDPHSVTVCTSQLPSVSMGARSDCAAAEPVAANDVKDNIEYGDDDLVGTGQGVL